MENIVEVKNLCKSYRVVKRESGNLKKVLKTLYKREFTTIKAVKNVTFFVQRGEIRGLIGSNGAGKSTMIKMICGILYPTSGDVSALGMNPWKQREEFVKQIGVVLGQKTQLWWDLPPIDTYELNKRMYNIPESIYQENLKYYIELLDIKEVNSRPVRQLSLGERMKCELMSSLLHNPELVFLDEPTIGLDIISKDIIVEIIKKINKERKTTFIVTTHDMIDIENLCKNITIINKGEKVYDSSIEKLRKIYNPGKVIEVYSKENIPASVLTKYNVVKCEKNCISIKIDRKENIGNLVEKLAKEITFNDITISNVDIEEIIKKIYLKRNYSTNNV